MAFRVHGRRATDQRGGFPPDYVFLLMPETEIARRVTRSAFIDFVVGALETIENYVSSTSPPLEEWQVTCALLPGHRLVTEVQVSPPPATGAHAGPITHRVRRLHVPAAVGPVAFCARRCLVPSDTPRGFSPPLYAFKTGIGSTDLDDVLMETAGLSMQPASLIDRLRARISRAVGTTRCAVIIAARTGLPVITTDGRVAFEAPLPQFQVERENPETGWASVVYANGAKGVVDGEFLASSKSAAPQPSQVSLATLVEHTASVRVLDGGTTRGVLVSESVLLTIDHAPDLKQLFETLEVLDGPGGHCMCLGGGPSLELRARDGSRVAVLGLHHGHAVRWSGWKDDARLLDGLSLLECLAAHGVHGPLGAHREAERLKREREAARQRWVARMPDALKAWPPDRWQKMIQANDVRDAVDTLLSAFPDARTAIKVLYQWFGSSRGPWTGFASYEGFPERLLLAFPIDFLLEAADDLNLSDDALGGAARLFAGHAFATHGATNSIPLSVVFAPEQQVAVPRRTAAPVAILPPRLT